MSNPAGERYSSELEEDDRADAVEEAAIPIKSPATLMAATPPLDAKAQAGHHEQVSPWSVLRHPVFRALTIASFVSNLGTWMHEIGGSWLMVTLKPSALIVSLMAAAGSLPMFLLALPAGALSDMLDRRRLLIMTQAWLCFWAAVLAGLTCFHLTTPWVLLTITFLLATGNALNWPAWQAITPEMVPKNEVSTAITLGGVNWNLSRIIGPTIGGVIVAKAGSAAVFAVNATSFLAVVFVLASWKRTPIPRQLPESVVGAMRAGLRYARHSPGLRASLIRCFGLLLCGSALWALLPLFARQDLQLDSLGYGWLMGWFGLGAVIGGLLLPKFRMWLQPGTVVTIAGIGIAFHSVVLSGLYSMPAIDAAMVFGGICWTAGLLTLNISVLHLSPEWVRSRSAAIYLLTFMGGMSGGSVLWGNIAEHVGIRTTFLYAGGIQVVLAMALHFLRIPRGEAFDLSPSKHWPIHTGAAADPNHHEGPVLVVMEYFVAAEVAEDFVAAMADIRRIRLRDGATRWELFQDTDIPERHIESFLVDSWAEHLRQHERLTVTDRAAEARAYTFTRSGTPPRVQHFVTRG